MSDVIFAMFALRFVSFWILLSKASVYATPLHDEENEGYPDYDTFKSLQEIGDKVFGHPSESSGEYSEYLQNFQEIPPKIFRNLDRLFPKFPQSSCSIF